MSKSVINDSTLTAIGDAIRAKTGKGALIAPGAMPEEIASIETGYSESQYQAAKYRAYQKGNAEVDWFGFDNEIGGGYVDLGNDEYMQYLPTNVFLHRIESNTWFYNTDPELELWDCDIVVIPQSIEFIPDFAFEILPTSWRNVYVICLGEYPASMGWQGNWSSTGGGYPPVAICVPDSSIEAYKQATNWDEFAGYIVGISELTKDIINGGANQ